MFFFLNLYLKWLFKLSRLTEQNKTKQNLLPTCLLTCQNRGRKGAIYRAQPNSISGGRPVSRSPCHDVCFVINIEARHLLHCHNASSSRGPRVKQRRESWDVITQSVCAILIKTLLTVLHYWNTPHRTLLNSLNKLAPAPLIIHRTMSALFLSPTEGNYDKNRGAESERWKVILVSG